MNLEMGRAMNAMGLKIEKKDHIAFIKILNTQGVPRRVVHLAEKVSELLGTFRFDGDIWVVILEAKGEGGFCVSEEEMARVSQEMASGGGIFSSIAESISRMEVPVIAGAEGDVMGLGLEWLLACDIRIASETSRFGLPHIKLGLLPFEGGTQRLARLVARGKAAEMILTGECIDAQEAMRIGLVNRIVPRSEVSEVVMELAKDMTSRSPISTRYIKEAICKGIDLSLDQGLRLEADLYFLMHTTRDRREGIRAFQEKREALFEGE
jgi:enoyl-CoA hydratase/carnithine racemase